MRKTVFVAALAMTAWLMPAAPAAAWGFAAHRLITTRAIDLLPPELKPFFSHFRDEVVARSVDPDLWRNAGWEDDPNHFLDFGVREFGDYPFLALPREYGAALEKFGIAGLKRTGMLPWRAAEEFGNLRRGFEGFARSAPYAPSDVVFFAAVASHYIQDAYQPFHSTNNFDGQLTGNNGIHSRFERDLIERYAPRLTLAPAAPAPMANARDAAFDAMLASYQLVDRILEADTASIRGKDTYNSEYLERFFGAVRPMLEHRLNDAITSTAALIIGAWEASGRPAVAIEGARPIETVRKK